jgi:hypothetical protein
MVQSVQRTVLHTSLTKPKRQRNRRYHRCILESHWKCRHFSTVSCTIPHESLNQNKAQINENVEIRKEQFAHLRNNAQAHAANARSHVHNNVIEPAAEIKDNVTERAVEIRNEQAPHSIVLNSPHMNTHCTVDGTL